MTEGKIKHDAVSKRLTAIPNLCAIFRVSVCCRYGRWEAPPGIAVKRAKSFLDQCFCVRKFIRVLLYLIYFSNVSGLRELNVSLFLDICFEFLD